MKNLNASVTIQSQPLWIMYISSIIVIDFKKKKPNHLVQYKVWNKF